MAFICLVFKWLGCLVFKWNSKIGPFGIKPPSDHLNTKQVWNQIPTVIRTNIFENNSSKINLNMFGVKCKVFLVCQQHFAVLKCFGCTTLLLIIEINKQVCFGYSYLHFNKKFRAYLILLETSCSLVQILWRSCLNRYILKFLGRSILQDSSFWYILASKIRAFCLYFCGKTVGNLKFRYASRRCKVGALFVYLIHIL